jgi:hypothetical protein
LDETFGQLNLVYESQSKVEKEINNETLVSLQSKTPSNNGNYNSKFQTKIPLVFFL